MAQRGGKALNGGKKWLAVVPGPPSSHLALLELKHRILASINKLSDRDTQQIAVEDLERIAESLSPDGIPLCLGCLYDINSEQKSMARRECIRLFGTLALLHGYLLAPYLSKIISCIVRRLRDPDTIVRDACVDAVGAIAFNVVSPEDENNNVDEGNEASFPSAFQVFFKPLVEALSEQNKHVQVGAAMCLARLIDSTSHPISSSMQRFYPRIVKLLKSSNFQAKAALLSVVGSLAKAEEVEADQFLASVVQHVLESLESSDWAIRRAAVEALMGVASKRGAAFSRLRSSVLEALESCRFDKVKPVRESTLNAIEMWKSVPALGNQLPATAAKKDPKGAVHHKSLKRASPSMNSNNCSLNPEAQNASEGYAFNTQASSSVQRVRVKQASISPASLDTCKNNSSEKRSSFRKNKKGNPDFFQKAERSFEDWPIEVIVPRGCPPSTVVALEVKNERSELNQEDTITESESGEPVDKPENVCQLLAIKEIVSVDQKDKSENGHHSTVSDKEELPCSQSKSRLAEDFASCRDATKQESSPKNEENLYSDNGLQERCPVDQSWGVPAVLAHSCSDTKYESDEGITHFNQLASIQRQLTRLEHQQSRLLEMLQEMMGSSHEGLQALTSRLQGLERTVDDVTKVTDLFSGEPVEKVKVMEVRSDDHNRNLEEPKVLMDLKSKVMNKGCSHSSEIMKNFDRVAQGARDRKLPKLVAELEAKRQGSFSASPQENWSALFMESKNDCSSNYHHLEKQMKMVKDNLEVKNSKGKGDSERELKFLRLAEVSSVKSVSRQQHCKDEASKQLYQVTGEKAISRPSQQDIHLLQSALRDICPSSTGENFEEGMEADVRDPWARALDYLQAGNINAAYVELLDSKDELLLVHLMARTGPVLDQLIRDTAKQVLNTVAQLSCKQSFGDFALPWIQQIADIITSNGLDYFDLSAGARSELMRLLQEASEQELGTTWFDSSGEKHCALELATV